MYPKLYRLQMKDNAAMMKMIGASVIIGIPELATASATNSACSKVITAYAGDCPCECQDRTCRDHCEDTLTNAAE